jgi:hypothetical protein
MDHRLTASGLSQMTILGRFKATSAGIVIRPLTLTLGDP